MRQRPINDLVGSVKNTTACLSSCSASALKFGLSRIASTWSFLSCKSFTLSLKFRTISLHCSQAPSQTPNSLAMASSLLLSLPGHLHWKMLSVQCASMEGSFASEQLARSLNTGRCQDNPFKMRLQLTRRGFLQRDLPTYKSLEEGGGLIPAEVPSQLHLKQ